MNAQFHIAPTSITADASDGQITLSLRERDSCVVVRLSEEQAREVIFCLEDVLNAIPRPAQRGSKTIRAGAAMQGD